MEGPLVKVWGKRKSKEANKRLLADDRSLIQNVVVTEEGGGGDCMFHALAKGLKGKGIGKHATVQTLRNALAKTITDENFKELREAKDITSAAELRSIIRRTAEAVEKDYNLIRKQVRKYDDAVVKAVAKELGVHVPRQKGLTERDRRSLMLDGIAHSMAGDVLWGDDTTLQMLVRTPPFKGVAVAVLSSNGGLVPLAYTADGNKIAHDNGSVTITAKHWITLYNVDDEHWQLVRIGKHRSLNAQAFAASFPGKLARQWNWIINP